MQARPPTAADLIRACDACAGEGEMQEYPGDDWEPCPVCAGTGHFIWEEQT